MNKRSKHIFAEKNTGHGSETVSTALPHVPAIAVSQYENIPVNSDPAIYEWALAEFAANQVKYMVAGVEFMKRALQDEHFIARSLSLMESLGMSYRGAHSFWGYEWDMNQLDPELHKKMLANQKKIIDIASQVQADVLVIHPGDSQFIDGTPSLSAMREQLYRTLDILIPYAQKRNIRIALENIIAPSDSAEEMFAVLEHYKSSSLVLCYDTGHANVMEDAPGKDPSKVCDYIRHSLWHDQLKLYHGKVLERLAPYIVTAHVHDNDGYDDQHKVPGHGSIDWSDLLKRLKACPKLEFVQNEAQWLKYGVSVKETVQCFNRLFA